jgi:hypothetical protein
MRRKITILSAFIIIFGFSFQSLAQFKPEEVAEREKWEEFLKSAAVVNQEQMQSREAVTSPWVLTLEKDGKQNRALWKNPEGRLRGFLENWRWEIAAYRLNKYLGLNMVPPTVEKRFKGDRGSCQLWIDTMMSLRDKTENKVKTPSYKVFPWNRCLYLQRAFDNLIANEDRHQNQYLITEDWRMILIDHSRSFRTSKKFTTKLIYGEKHKEGARLMKELPRSFVEKLREMNQEVIREVVGEYLTDKEIDAVLKRRDLIIQWIDNRIKEMGEDKVLYD